MKCTNLPSLTSFFRNLVNILLIFIIVYSNSYPTIPLVSNNDRIALLVMVFSLFILGFTFKKPSHLIKNTFGKLWVFNLFLFLYVLIVLIVFGFGEGENILGSLAYFLLFMPVSFLFFSKTIKSADQLMHYLSMITLIQSIIIFISIVNGEFASKIDYIFNQNQYFDFALMRKQGYPGGIWCITSTGAMQLSLGLISSSYFIIKKRNKLLNYCLFIFFSFISIAVARTAIVVVGACAIILLFSIIAEKGWESLKGILAISIIAIALVIILNQPSVKDSLPAMFKRVFELKERGLYNGFFSGYFNGKTTIIPKIQADTIIGTGITSGISGQGIEINADGGFVRMYCAIGLPLSIVFYGLLIWIIFKCFKACDYSVDKLSIIMFGIVFIIGEFKEPFFYKKYFWLVIFLFVYFMQKSNPYNLNKCHFSSRKVKGWNY